MIVHSLCHGYEPRHQLSKQCPYAAALPPPPIPTHPRTSFDDIFHGTRSDTRHSCCSLLQSDTNGNATARAFISTSCSINADKSRHLCSPTALGKRLGFFVASSVLHLQALSRRIPLHVIDERDRKSCQFTHTPRHQWPINT